MKETTDSQRNSVYFAMLPANILSILGCLFILIVFLSFKALHKFSFTLVFILTIFDLILSVSFMIPASVIGSNSTICKTQAFIINFSSFCGVIWTTFISISLYSIIAKGNIFPKKHCKYFLIGIIAISLSFATVPIFTETYGLVAGWCWIIQTGEFDAGFYERYLGFFIPVWLMIVLIITLYALLIVHINKYSQNKIEKSLVKRLSIYPVILVVCYLPYTVKTVLEIMDISFVFEHMVEFTSIAGIFRGLIGFLNAVVYGYTKKVKEEIRTALKKNGDKDKLGLAKAINHTKIVQLNQYPEFSDT